MNFRGVNISATAYPAIFSNSYDLTCTRDKLVVMFTVNATRLNPHTERTNGAFSSRRTGREAMSSGQSPWRSKDAVMIISTELILARNDPWMCDNENPNDNPSQCSDPNFNVGEVTPAMKDITNIYNQSFVSDAQSQEIWFAYHSMHSTAVNASSKS